MDGTELSQVPHQPESVLTDGLLFALAVATGPEAEAGKILTSWGFPDWRRGRTELDGSDRY